MTLSRRRLVQLLSAAPALLNGMQPARAETFPARPLRIIAPWPVGGAVEARARARRATLSRS
jgi:tripartite-type tricarboxylate transporter receptor subunit TctC